MSSQENSARQFIRKGVRESRGMGRFTFAGAAHRLQWNENPYDYPDDLKEEVKQRMAVRGWAHYPNGLRPFDLIDRLAERFDLPADMVIVSGGSASMIKLVMSAILDPGDHMTLLSPTFLIYRRNAGLLGAQVHEVAADPADDFALPVEELVVRARTNEAKLVALCAPNNPTGTVYSIDQVRHVAAESGSLVLVDEAYAEFSGQDMCALLSEFDNVILLRTFSKAFAMAGLRVGYALAPAALARELDKNVDPFPVSTLSETAALVALENLDHFMGNVERIIDERARLSAALAAQPGVHVYSSGANFLLVQLARSPQPLVDGLAREHGIMISDVAAYPELPNTVRITVGLPEANDTVIEAVAAFAAEG